jgi:hypothetical protein
MAATREQRRRAWRDAQAHLEGLIDGVWARAPKATRWPAPNGHVASPVAGEPRVEADVR